MLLKRWNMNLMSNQKPENYKYKAAEVKAIFIFIWNIIHKYEQ